MKRKSSAPKKKAPRKLVAKKRQTSRSKPVVKKPERHVKALQYLVDSEERESKLMIATSMGLIPD
jgi:hypothetical protein